MKMMKLLFAVDYLFRVTTDEYVGALDVLLLKRIHCTVNYIKFRAHLVM
jgi:hypothetical protein